MKDDKKKPSPIVIVLAIIGGIIGALAIYSGVLDLLAGA